MFEALDRMQERESKRLPNNIFDPPKVNNLNDIKAIIKKVFDDAPATVAEVTASVQSEGATITTKVNTKSKSVSDLIIDGFTMVNNRLVIAEKHPSSVWVNGHEMRPAALLNPAVPWLDGLLERTLSATRDGKYICWTLSDGYTYQYDPLTRSFGRNATAAATGN